jgi:hypothetical protein
LVGATGWLSAGTVDVSITSEFIQGVIAGSSYNVRVRSLTNNGSTSAWDEVDNQIVSAPNTQQNTYVNNPQIALTNPTSTTIALAAVAVTFGSRTVNYSARTFTITAPSVPTWYYITIADSAQVGESSPTLTPTVSVTNSLVGVQGNTYMGAIQVIPTGGGTHMLAGGWPAPQTVQVGV